MNKYVFAYDTHILDTDNYDHNDVRKAIINFLLDNGVAATTIIEPVDTTIVFKSETDTADWHKLITDELLPTMLDMMEDLYYYFASIKKHSTGTFFDYERPNRTLKNHFRDLVNEVVEERKNA